MLDSQRLLAETDWLRSLARSLVGPADGDDLCQETLVAALERMPRVDEGLRPWLSSVARRLSAQVHRRKLRREKRERAAAKDEAIPSAGELVEQAFTQRTVVDAVLKLDEPYRETVLLRFFQGLSTRDLAAHHGVPIETARTRLKRALAMLRARLDQSAGGRSAWAPVVGAFGGSILAPSTKGIAAANGISEVLAMSLKTKVILGVAAALALVAILFPWGQPPTPRPEALTDSPVQGVATQDEGRSAYERVAERAKPESREAIDSKSPTAPPTTGTLLVHVLYGEGDTPLADVGVRVLDSSAVDRMYGSALARTNPEGSATFPALPEGPCRVWTDRIRMGMQFQRPTIVAGETTEIEIRLEAGIDIEGMVVDSNGVGVGGAEVHLAVMVFVGHDTDPVATTDTEGKFLLRGCEPTCLVGARAFGHTQAPMQLVQASPGATVPLRLELGPAGGGVSGQVVDSGGEPIVGAVVRIGASSRGASLSGYSVPAQTRTDVDGMFLAIGLAPGEHPITIRAPRYGLWTGKCTVAANTATPLHITLQPGVTCSGTITDADGTPAIGADVHVGELRTLSRFEARTNTEGAYRLEGLPDGEFHIEAEHSDRGKASGVLHGIAGEALRWDASLSTGTRLCGRVVDQRGEPVTRQVEVIARGMKKGKRWTGHDGIGEDGRFAIDNCPETGTLHVDVLGARIHEVNLEDVDPRAGELLVHVRRIAEPSAKIVGMVIGPDGKPCGDAVVWAIGRGVSNTGFLPCDLDTGRFEIGPLSPTEYEVKVSSESYPKFSSERIQLAADETLDLGTIRLVEGGRVRVDLSSPLPDKTNLLITNIAGKFGHRFSPGGSMLSAPLSPGRHRLNIHGPNVAGDTVSFEILAGITTSISVELFPAQPRRIEVTVPFDDDELHSVAIEVRSSEGKLVLHRSRSAREGKVEVVCGFAPGAYTVSATCEDRRGAGQFHVDSESVDAPTIRVQIE